MIDPARFPALHRRAQFYFRDDKMTDFYACIAVASGFGDSLHGLRFDDWKPANLEKLMAGLEHRLTQTVYKSAAGFPQKSKKRRRK